jgi:hypothetical protein
MPFVKAYPKTSGGRIIVYEDEKENQTLYQYGSRSWRTNNPGNIARGKFCTRHGAIGDDGVNAIFPDVAAGFAALGAQLLQGSAYKVWVQVRRTPSESFEDARWVNQPGSCFGAAFEVVVRRLPR